VLRFPSIYPVHMRVVDAATSNPVRARCTVEMSGSWVGRDPQHPCRFFALLQPDEFCVLRFRVEPPEGYVGWDRPDVFARVSPFAERLDFVYPLREAFDAVVTATLDGAGVAGLRIGSLSIASRDLTGLDVKADAHDRLHVRGLPHLRHEPMRLRVVSPTQQLRGDRDFTLPEAPENGISLPVELAAQFFNDPGHASTSGWTFERPKLRLPTSEPIEGRPARVRISVRRRTGEAAVGARVWMNNATRRTDARGRVTFEDVPPGVQVATVKQAGMVALLERLTIKPGVEQEFSLRETQGGMIRVTVSDEEGRPLPYARLDLWQASMGAWVDLEGRVQRIDTFTDHRGQRLLRDVQHGRVRIIATWGSRRNDVFLDLQPGSAEVPARIVLRRSK